MPEVDALASAYLARASRFISCTAQNFATEAAFLLNVGQSEAIRTPAHVILLDPRGKLLSSEAFATHLGQQRDSGTQNILFAVGPADGWSPAARARANLLLSLGPMTFSHELARVVLAEQIYRALTILAGHPYHTGH